MAPDLPAWPFPFIPPPPFWPKPPGEEPPPAVRANLVGVAMRVETLQEDAPPPAVRANLVGVAMRVETLQQDAPPPAVRASLVGVAMRVETLQEDVPPPAETPVVVLKSHDFYPNALTSSPGESTVYALLTLNSDQMLEGVLESRIWQEGNSTGVTKRRTVRLFPSRTGEPSQDTVLGASDRTQYSTGEYLATVAFTWADGEIRSEEARLYVRTWDARITFPGNGHIFDEDHPDLNMYGKSEYLAQDIDNSDEIEWKVETPTGDLVDLGAGARKTYTMGSKGRYRVEAVFTNPTYGTRVAKQVYVGYEGSDEAPPAAVRASLVGVAMRVETLQQDAPPAAVRASLVGVAMRVETLQQDAPPPAVRASLVGVAMRVAQA